MSSGRRTNRRCNSCEAIKKKQPDKAGPDSFATISFATSLLVNRAYRFYQHTSESKLIFNTFLVFQILEGFLEELLTFVVRCCDFGLTLLPSNETASSRWEHLTCLLSRNSYTPVWIIFCFIIIAGTIIDGVFSVLSHQFQLSGSESNDNQDTNSDQYLMLMNRFNAYVKNNQKNHQFFCQELSNAGYSKDKLWLIDLRLALHSLLDTFFHINMARTALIVIPGTLAAISCLTTLLSSNPLAIFSYSPPAILPSALSLLAFCFLMLCAVKGLSKLLERCCVCNDHTKVESADSVPSHSFQATGKHVFARTPKHQPGRSNASIAAPVSLIQPSCGPGSS